MKSRIPAIALLAALLGGFSIYSAHAQSCSGQPSANTICAGPTSGGTGLASWRALVGADFPASTVPWASITGTPTTLSGYGITNARTAITGNITYYVNGSSSSTAPCGPTGASTCQPGSDSNNGLSPSTPWLTAQHAINVLNAGVDFAGFTPIINLAHGSSANYSFNCQNGPWLGNVEVKVQGDTASPTAVGIIAPNSSYAAFVKDSCTMAIDSVQITDAGTASGAIHVGQRGTLDISNVTFGAFNSGADHIYVESPGAKVNVLSGNSIGGGAGHHIDIQAQGAVDFNSQTVAIPVAKAFTSFAFLAGPSEAKGLSTGTFTGAGVAGTTGIRAQISGNAYVAAGGGACNSVFPGNANCQITQGGQDDAADNLTTPWSVPNGGTGNATQTAHAILLGEGASAQAGVGPCAANQIVIGQGASSDPICGSTRQSTGSATTNTLSQASTGFVGNQNNFQTTAVNAVTVAVSGTIRSMYINAGNAPAAGQTYTMTLQVGAFGSLSDTAVTCQIDSAHTSCNDTTHSAAISAGQTWAIKFVTSATSGTLNGASWGLEFDNP